MEDIDGDIQNVVLYWKLTQILVKYANLHNVV